MLGKCGPVWGNCGDLLWDLPDTKCDFTFNWSHNGLFVVELSVSSFGAGSSDTKMCECHVDFTIWNCNFKAETIFEPVDWGDGGGVEILEIGAR